MEGKCIDDCVYSYITYQVRRHTPYLIHGTKDSITRNVSDICDKIFVAYEGLKNIVIERKPIPLEFGGGLAPVFWYYKLFTKDELVSALDKYDSPFPTKYFASFSGLPPIRLMPSEKVLVEFIKVDKLIIDTVIDTHLKGIESRAS